MENELKERLYKLMEENDYVDENICGDVEVFVELEFPKKYIKEILDDNKRIRQMWFEWCYDHLEQEEQNKYLKLFKLIKEEEKESMDYVLNVFKGNEFLYAIGGNHMNYDNVIWWQLDELINVVSKNETATAEELLEKIQNKCAYFSIVLDEEQKGEPVLDLTKKTIDINHMNLFNFEDVTFINVGKKLIRVDDDFKIEYEYADEEPFDVTHINYDLDLLCKNTLNYDELLTIARFINELINKSECDFIVNNEKALLLTSI